MFFKFIQLLYSVVLRRNVEANEDNVKIISNSGWLLFEKVFRFALTFVLSIILARYLGPEDFGNLTYFVAVINIIGILIHLGLRIVVIDELVKYPKKRSKILGSAFTAKIMGAGLAFALLYFFGSFSLKNNPENLYLIMTLGLIFIFRPVEVITYYFESELKARKNVVAKNIALTIVFVLNIIFVLVGLELFYFAIAILIEYFIISLIYILFYLMEDSVLSWRFDWLIFKRMLSKSWYLIFSGLLAIIYLKMDRVMLNFLYSVEEVGIYGIASNFSEAWYFIPAAVVYSFYPKLASLRTQDKKAYYRLLQRLFNFLFLCSFFLSLIMTLTGRSIINFVYGELYSRAGIILIIHIWSGIFIFMRELFDKWLVLEGRLRYTLLVHGIGAVSNVSLNFLLIPRWGGIGAALATLISYATASYLVLFISGNIRVIAFMMTKAILSPLKKQKRV